ncbi:protection of telomeres protein 1a-like [Hibiscus syriacus]|uniref:protection of telomeres protein 1a-like n=1 Tax=Hibiscus syriacus TaxID=106335 RepID=UPI00192252CE|nr:protection of telomeres protein 1a-like [Hibiscus syriacus]
MGDYKFLKIKDAIACINQNINIIAVIVDLSPPQKTRGTDYICKLKIIDESYEFGIPVHLFAQQIGDLPLAASVGDIIHFSSVKMEMHDGVVYAVFNKKVSSFALYDGKDGEDFHPYKVSLRFHARDHDEKIIAGLRKWLASSEVIYELGFLLLREINQVIVGGVNLACKVLHICKSTNDEWMVFLWDGTDAPPISINKRLEDEMHNPLPLHFEPLPSSRDVLSTFPTAGTILRMRLDVNCITDILQLLKAGRWVKLFRVSCKVHEGLWYGVFTSASKIQDMPNDDILVLERQSNYDRRSIRKLDRMPYWSFPWASKITEVNCDDAAPFVTLMDLLTNQKVPMRFRCVIRVVAVVPWRVEDFRRRRDGLYRVRFTLEDPTTRIHAYAFAEDGERFFNSSSTDALRRKLTQLLGVPSSGGARNPPWVECCLMSHSVGNGSCICDTKLLD